MPSPRRYSRSGRMDSPHRQIDRPPQKGQRRRGRRAQGLKVIIPSIKRPGTNFRDELPAISSAGKRNAHEGRGRLNPRERRLSRGKSSQGGVTSLRPMTTARSTCEPWTCSLAREAGRGGEGRGGGKGEEKVHLDQLGFYTMMTC